MTTPPPTDDEPTVSASQDGAPPTDDGQEPFITENFMARTVTALVGLPLVLVALYVGGALWLALMTVVGAVGTMEFYGLARGRPERGAALVGVLAFLGVLAAFYLNAPAFALAALAACGVAALVWAVGAGRPPVVVALMTVVGVLYVGLPTAFLADIRQQSAGFAWIMVIFAVTWGTDTAAYFGGRLFGRRKLAPTLSPSKTIEGAVIGAVGGFLGALLILTIADLISIPALIMVAVAPGVAIVGDLLESGLKRHFGVKDSHLPGFNIVPGHGGVLDRIDALICVTLFCYPVMVFSGILA